MMMIVIMSGRLGGITLSDGAAYEQARLNNAARYKGGGARSIHQNWYRLQLSARLCPLRLTHFKVNKQHGTEMIIQS